MSNLRVGTVSTANPRLQVVYIPRADIVPTNVSMLVRRFGDAADSSQYVPLQVMGNVMLFQFDALVFDMPYGRYAGTLVYNGEPYASLEFNYTPDIGIAPAQQISTIGPYNALCDKADPNWSGTGVSGPGTFIGLKDVQHSYSGCANFIAFVRPTEDGIDFLPLSNFTSAAWGAIGGTLSSQTDLQAALNGKATATQGAKADSALQSVVAGSNVSINSTDPRNPIISVSGGGASGVQSVVAGTNVTINNTDPHNPVISASGGGAGGVQSIVSGNINQLSVNNSDPANPVLSVVPGAFVNSLTAGSGIAINNSNPGHPVITATGGGSGGGTVNSITAGAGITVSTSSPNSPAAPAIACVGGYSGSSYVTDPAYVSTRADLGTLVRVGATNGGSPVSFTLDTANLLFNPGEWVDIMQFGDPVQIRINSQGQGSLNGFNGTRTLGAYNVRRCVYVGNYNWVVI